MEWLNYHHLLYFWMVMREGSITAASERLRLAQSTVSAQLKQFEQNLGTKLFRRVGRGLEPTEMGLLVFRYAEQIFSLGRELMDSVHGRSLSGPSSLRVGIADVVPKLVVHSLLKPAGKLSGTFRLACHEGKDEQLLADLALHQLDVVLSDTPFRSNLGIKAYNHLLGECGVSFLATEKLASPLRGGFPHSLNGQPLLLPMPMSTERAKIDAWLERFHLRPIVVAEFDDYALLKVFGQEGAGIFLTPTVIENEVRKQYQVSLIGRTEKIRERYYAISVERIIKHPAVIAISEAAHDIFQASGARALP